MSQKTLPPSAERVLSHLRAVGGWHDAEAIAAAVRLSPNTTREALAKLRRHHRVPGGIREPCVRMREHHGRRLYEAVPEAVVHPGAGTPLQAHAVASGAPGSPWDRTEQLYVPLWGPVTGWTRAQHERATRTCRHLAGIPEDPRPGRRYTRGADVEVAPDALEDAA